MDFTGKRVLVTGGSRGIGRAIAAGFAGRGARVAINYHSSRAAAEETLAALPGGVIALAQGEGLEAVSRAEISDLVPARSLIWATEFYRCLACQHIYWEGTHWRQIRAVRDQIVAGLTPHGISLTGPPCAVDNGA